MTRSFEWNDQKAVENARKHGVTFQQAELAFTDLFCVEELEDSMPYGEERWTLTGVAAGEILVVVYTERGSNIRIISARRATKHEREHYYRVNSEGR
jgi:uncharacterized DUF497 family protein